MKKLKATQKLPTSVLAFAGEESEAYPKVTYNYLLVKKLKPTQKLPTSVLAFAGEETEAYPIKVTYKRFSVRW